MMAFTNGSDPTEAQVAMTLSALAYANEAALPGETLTHHQARIRAKIIQELQVTGYATHGEWHVAWGPGLTNGNLLYVAQKTGTSQYCVAIRGTDWHFLVDWIEDFDVLNLGQFPYARSPDPDIRIAQGMMDGLNDLLGMTGLVSLNAEADGPATVSLLQFVMHVAAEAQTDVEVLVTGHSLGGGLASVVAAWLAFEVSQWQHLSGHVIVKPCTFAAPSAGNSHFATYYNALFGDNARRYYNTLDVVPNAWQTLATIKTYYPPQPPCPDLIKGLIDAAELAVLPDAYSQPATAEPLQGAVDPAYSTDFLKQVAYQHGSNTYLTLLGAEPIDWLATAKPAALRVR